MKHPTALSTPSPIRSMKNESSIQQSPHMHNLQNKEQLPLSPSRSSASSCYSQPDFADTPENVSNLPSSPNEKSLYSISSSSFPPVFPSSVPRETFSPSESINDQEVTFPDQSLNSSLSKNMFSNPITSTQITESITMRLGEQKGFVNSNFSQDKPKHAEVSFQSRVDPQDLVSTNDKLQPSLPIVDSSTMHLSAAVPVNTLAPVHVSKQTAAPPIDDIILSPAIPIPPRSSKHIHDRSLHNLGDKTTSLPKQKFSNDLRNENILSLQNSSVDYNLFDNVKSSESQSTLNRQTLALSKSMSVSSTPDKNHNNKSLEISSSNSTNTTLANEQSVAEKLLQLQSENTQLWKLVKEQQAMIIGLQNDLNAIAAKNKEYKTELENYKNMSCKVPDNETTQIIKEFQKSDISSEQVSNFSNNRGLENSTKITESNPVQKNFQSPLSGLDFTDSNYNVTEKQASPAARSLRSSRERASPITKADDTFDFQIKPFASTNSVSLFCSKNFFFLF